MPDLRLDSSSDSDSSESYIETPKVDDFGRPLSKPVFRSVGESSVLSRAREFLPLFKEATLRLSEPRIHKQEAGLESIRLPNEMESDDSSESSFGVEVDVGLGVYDVHGDVDEVALTQKGTPIIFTEDETLQKGSSGPLIEEM